MAYQEINSETMDRWCAAGWEWGKPLSHETYLRAQRGEWDVLLTPTKPVPHEWFGDLKGKRVLGLASGGGQQIPVFAALGARCTLLDYSAAQCRSDREVAAREGYEVEVIQGDMTKRFPFPDGAFDLIFHPVSNCYIEEVEPVFRECFRLLALYEDTNGSGNLHEHNVPSFVATYCVKPAEAAQGFDGLGRQKTEVTV